MLYMICMFFRFMFKNISCICVDNLLLYDCMLIDLYFRVDFILIVKCFRVYCIFEFMCYV